MNPWRAHEGPMPEGMRLQPGRTVQGYGRHWHQQVGTGRVYTAGYGATDAGGGPTEPPGGGGSGGGTTSEAGGGSSSSGGGGGGSTSGGGGTSSGGGGATTPPQPITVTATAAPATSYVPYIIGVSMLAGFAILGYAVTKKTGAHRRFIR